MHQQALLNTKNLQNLLFHREVIDMPHTNVSFPAPEIIGLFKTFGNLGPAYQVLDPIAPTDDGKDWWVSVRILESGEITRYKLTHLLQDPEAR
jgi:hypothetical protein